MSIHFGEVFLIALVAGMSPGPDFFVVMRNSLGFGLRVGVATALGVALALVVHVAYTVGGFAFVIVRHPEALLAIRVLGAAYLGWLGVKALRARSDSLDVAAAASSGGKAFGGGIRDGLLCNLLNPKAPLFFLAVFGQFLGASTPLWAQCVYGIEAVVAIGGWFVALSFIIDRPWFRTQYARWSVWIDRVFGVLLLGFGARILAAL
jgi:RhtB (resistance to homoserine/threonine) family protein